MNVSDIRKKALEARRAAHSLGVIGTPAKNNALFFLAESLLKNTATILAENKKDMQTAEEKKLPAALMKRLELDELKIKEIIWGVQQVAALDDPIGKILLRRELDHGLILTQVTVPIGVIGAIFESRPDAVVQIAALCIKSGNVVIMKGGSEALHSNIILAKIIADACVSAGLPRHAVQLIENREEVTEMLTLDSDIDLLIPRGSGQFVKYIMQHTKIPVLGHAQGICHVYVDTDAEIEKATAICFDAKCQYPAACNAMEHLLIHRAIAEKFLPVMATQFLAAGVELRGDTKTLEILKPLKSKKIKAATDEDWKTEYSDLILSIKIVAGLSDAIAHINTYGSRHTEAIVTENKEHAKTFMNGVDASSVMWNCSPRFADGFRYGKGAEVGISTGKIHARGPVGLEGLVTYKYKLIGNGHVVKNYVGQSAKKFTHRTLDATDVKL